LETETLSPSGTAVAPPSGTKVRCFATRTLLDRAEDGLVGLRIDIDVLELADLVAVAVDQVLALPVSDVLDIRHLGPPPRSVEIDDRRYQRTSCASITP